jgi:hypothetical protein
MSTLPIQNLITEINHKQFKPRHTHKAIFLNIFNTQCSSVMLYWASAFRHFTESWWLHLRGYPAKDDFPQDLNPQQHHYENLKP